ncbi:glycosyltransferase family 4 protein [Flavobacterium sp. 3HN19-14]|uniref:glycosyltransferase family 4 protein n=1 Tax=Flavobacterium sp. 3HN19-14 TaxID=3448133 RepID=UPI003EDEB29A
MRILQIIDSLEAGGAERMAVNYANFLAAETGFSALAVTRKESPLKQNLNPEAAYIFLERKSTIDLAAVLKLRKFAIANKIDIIHAHSTSFFIAFLLKMLRPSLCLVWHDHYGDSEFLGNRPSKMLKLAMPFFAGIIVVNQKLKDWAKQELKFKNVIMLPNFPAENEPSSEVVALKGISGKRILCLANLREQKNHHLLLDVAVLLKNSHPEWTFHLVGKDFEDDYSSQIKSLILSNKLDQNVFVYGTINGITSILEQSEIGILTSKSEGLPLALLEYGLHKKAVVVTAVGEIPEIIQNGINGMIVPSGDVKLFYNELLSCIENLELRESMSEKLRQTILSRFSVSAIMNDYISWMKSTDGK